jgi:hypothetical protein
LLARNRACAAEQATLPPVYHNRRQSLGRHPWKEGNDHEKEP